MVQAYRKYDPCFDRVCNRDVSIFISQRFLYQGSNSKSKSKHKAKFLPQRLGVNFKLIHYFQSIMSRKQRERERERATNDLDVQLLPSEHYI